MERINGSTGTVRCFWATSDGTSRSPVGYKAAQGVLTFAQAAPCTAEGYAASRASRGIQASPGHPAITRATSRASRGIQASPGPADSHPVVRLVMSCWLPAPRPLALTGRSTAEAAR